MYVIKWLLYIQITHIYLTTYVGIWIIYMM